MDLPHLGVDDIVDSGPSSDSDGAGEADEAPTAAPAAASAPTAAAAPASAPAAAGGSGGFLSPMSAHRLPPRVPLHSAGPASPPAPGQLPGPGRASIAAPGSARPASPTRALAARPASTNPADVFPMVGGPQRAAMPGIPRKTPLSPGHSPLDWAKLTTSGADLRGGITQLQRFTRDEVALHRKRDDMWMAYRGRVYNVTPYVPFHPGGFPQLMRGAGKDATELILKVHPWVNVEMLLDKCWIGYLI
ncbi:hypothetical protein HK105_202492 [Polyrhizophydium stewartii]|uniref:Cytochrome b5 heme-binding domain-containing protein n=1 Tax=Polyrhizophydium stewartii TaxID=2732419 RepID=A0ABR4NEX4_9FUNG